MSVLALVTTTEEAKSVISWSARFAVARSTTLTVLCWTDSPTLNDSQVISLSRSADIDDSQPLLTLARELLQEFVDRDNDTSCHMSRDDVVLRHVMHPSPRQATLERMRFQDPSLLVIGGHTLRGRTEKNGTSTSSRASVDFLRNASCDAVALYSDDHRSFDADRILLLSTDGRNDRMGLMFATEVAEQSDGKLTALRIEENVGKQAIEVGQRDLQSLLKEMQLGDNAHIETRVALSDDIVEGIADSAGESDLVILGDDVPSSAVDNLLRVRKSPAVAVFSRKPPLKSWDPRAKFAEWIPRIRPADYTDLYQRLLNGSRWNIDFVMMLALATVIASLGLLQDSPAVVIGSMLLAPLMTPMIGAGLALVQGNYGLARRCTQSIGYGFLMALGLSFCVGFFTPGNELTPQLVARGEPNLLDLLIALFSAIVAAYAMARPGIAAAVAGVAIATALVPPLSTVGIALSYGEWDTAYGAAVLFITNLVAIVMGASFMFRMMGVAGAIEVPRRRLWALRARFGVIAAAILLAIPLGYDLEMQVNRGKARPMAFPVTRNVGNALKERVAQDKGVTLILAGRPSRKLETGEPQQVGIILGCDHPLPRSYSDEIAAIVRDEMMDDSIEVHVWCLQHQWKDESPGKGDTSSEPFGVTEVASGAE